MMKKLVIGLLGLVSALLLVACGKNSGETSGDNWSKYQSNKSITIGFDSTFVPMGFAQKDGSYAGFDIDLATVVFEKYGITVNWQPIDWDLKEAELTKGTIDLIWNGYSATDERRQKVAFSNSYMQNEQVLVTKKSSGIQATKDMAGKSLGAQAGSSGYADFEANPAILKDIVANNEANQYQTFNEALIDLKNDRIDALLIDRVYANYYLEAEGILNDYNVFTVGLETESFAVGARKEDTTLIRKINEGFSSLYKEGKFQEISQKWFGEDVATEEIKK